MAGLLIIDKCGVVVRLEKRQQSSRTPYADVARHLGRVDHGGLRTDLACDKYFLKSVRVGFRCWAEEDWALARELWGDIEVTKFFGGPFSEEEIRGRFEAQIRNQRELGFQYWPIFELASGDLVGCCGLRPYWPDKMVHELGFHLRPKFWGQGLAIEAARAVIPYSFETIGAKGLSAGHHPGNVNSKKVLEKLGFRYSHEERFEALGIEIPYYLMARSEVA